MQPIRYGFTTKDGQRARIDLTQVRSILPSGFQTGFVKLVLDGGHSITVAGDAESLNDMIVSYTRHPDGGTHKATPQLPHPHGLSVFRDTKYKDVYAARNIATVLSMAEDARGYALDATQIELLSGDVMLKDFDTGVEKPAGEWLAGVTKPTLLFSGSK